MSELTWAQAPIGRTLTTLQKTVAGYVLMPTDPEVLETARQGVMFAIDELNMRVWDWNVAEQDITFEVGVREYTLDAQFKAPHNFAVLDTASRSVARISFKPWKSFLVDHQNLTAESDPYVYTVPNAFALGTIRLNGAPSDTWAAVYPTGHLSYYARIPYPTTTGNTLSVPSEVIAYIEAQAEGFTADRYATDKARLAYARADRLNDKLIRDANNNYQTDWERP